MIDRKTVKRWSKVSLRTLHLVALAGVGGGVLFALDRQLWINYWYLALASGVLMMLIDVIANPLWIIQIRGLSILVKLVLLAFLGSYPDWDPLLLAVVIVISAVISHAPGKLRYYSVYHQKVINSDQDLKG